MFESITPGEGLLLIGAVTAFVKLFFDVSQFKTKNVRDFESYQAAWHKEIREEAHKKNGELQKLSNQITILFQEKQEYLKLINELQSAVNDHQRQINAQMQRLSDKDAQLTEQALQIQELTTRLNKYEPPGHP